jgi:hypothetical protein
LVCVGPNLLSPSNSMSGRCLEGMTSARGNEVISLRDEAGFPQMSRDGGPWGSGLWLAYVRS